MCRRNGCHHLPVRHPGATYVAYWTRPVWIVWTAVASTAADAGGPAVRDRGKSYARQVAETVWVAAAFGGGMALGALMAGAK